MVWRWGTFAQGSFHLGTVQSSRLRRCGRLHRFFSACLWQTVLLICSTWQISQANAMLVFIPRCPDFIRPYIPCCVPLSVPCELETRCVTRWVSFWWGSAKKGWDVFIAFQPQTPQTNHHLEISFLHVVPHRSQSKKTPSRAVLHWPSASLGDPIFNDTDLDLHWTRGYHKRRQGSPRSGFWGKIAFLISSSIVIPCLFWRLAISLIYNFLGYCPVFSVLLFCHVLPWWMGFLSDAKGSYS